MSQVAGQAAGQPLEGEVWYGPGSWKAEGGSMARENLIMRHCQEENILGSGNDIP